MRSKITQNYNKYDEPVTLSAGSPCVSPISKQIDFCRYSTSLAAAHSNQLMSAGFFLRCQSHVLFYLFHSCCGNVSLVHIVVKSTNYYFIHL
ncbi:unnamed protein product [Auanema sp. JU1783]|nr:unnamed protein product [Auanema sp. JU1783]